MADPRVGFAIQLVIARLPGPGSYGVYALAFAINEVLLVLSALPLNQAVVRALTASQSLYDTAFAPSFGLCIIGIVLAG